MLLPISWLKKFININATPEQIAAKLTLSGSEVEKIVKHDAGLSKVYVGLIKEIKPHPNADKLRLAYVDIGQNKLLEIVCGAPNIEAGQKVPVVMLGGSVPARPLTPERSDGGRGMKIEPRDIRGVKSQGMLCSQKELGLGDDHSGIFVLPADAQIGTDVTKLLELNEPVLELEITPNRADCFSVRGLAREIGALYGVKTKSPESRVKEGGKKISSVLKVEIKDKELCPKYMARVVEDITVGPSPLWLQNKLRQVGIKSINNIVDVTNYVLMELGQPLHAFDSDLLGDKIVVRKAKPGEKIMALDDKIYKLDASMLVITDGKEPVAIAGVMGGKDTGVHAGTTRIVLESAIFDSVSVRKTSKALGLRSESSARFEKGLDPAATAEALNLAAKMIAELSGGVVLKGTILVGSGFKPGRSVKISANEITNLLGIEIKPPKIKAILQSLGFGVKPPLNLPLGKGERREDVLTIKIPSWRADVSQTADIVEEIGRMVDYNTLPKTLPSGALQSKPEDGAQTLRRSLRQLLGILGYSEILTYSFYDDKALALSDISKDRHIVVTNPVNQEHRYLRASLVPGMLSKLSQNSALLSGDSFRLFEIGKIFTKPHQETWQAVAGIIEVTSSQETLYRTLREVVEYFLQRPVTVHKTNQAYNFLIDEQVIATVHLLGKGQVPNLRFRSGVGVMTIDLEALQRVQSTAVKKFKPLPYYPQIERDLAIIVPNNVEYKEIEEAIVKHDPLLKAGALFDVYHGLHEGKSLAFRLTFGSTDRTLESKVVDEIVENLKSALKKKFKVNFR